jgi:hypothetical protein
MFLPVANFVGFLLVFETFQVRKQRYFVKFVAALVQSQN